MAKPSKEPETQYVKKGVHENPVIPCKGWFDPCEYCDKRFCEWVTVDEEIYEKIPEKPGFFMIALKKKNTIEVVSLLYNKSNIQKLAISTMDYIKEQISDKKSKISKSEMLVRWMIIKKVDDKENSILCAHWYNNGVLPRFLTAWPGQNLLEESEAVVFSKQTQKWCYPQKNPVWRKPKPPSSKSITEVKKCNFQSCEICDSFFTPWQSLDYVIEKDLAPKDGGLVMLSVLCGKKREVILIDCDRKYVVIPIKFAIENYKKQEDKYLKYYVNQNPSLQVRWAIIKDIDSDDSCYLYAHWLNADNWPQFTNNYTMAFAEEHLNKNKHFIFRTNDKKWFYEIETLKPPKNRKAKSKRELYDELNAEDYDIPELS